MTKRLPWKISAGSNPNHHLKKCLYLSRPHIASGQPTAKATAIDFNIGGGSKMALKEWCRSLRPVQLYVMLTLTLVFFVVQLVMSHMTHALTLLVDACHMLCNLIALAGCLVTIRKSRENLSSHGSSAVQQGTDEKEVEPRTSASVCGDVHDSPLSVRERRLRNTFGWARVDVVVMLVCCVFLASLCFSTCVEAAQTLVHIDHHDEMHRPLAVLCLGAAGILLNGLCYLLIGGYTFHQGSFLRLTDTGEFVLDDVKVTAQKRGLTPIPPARGAWAMARDVNGCVLVIICSLIVHYTDQSVAKFVDPLMAILSACLLLGLSLPYLTESGLILLQTIPNHIDIALIRKQLLKEYPDIVNVHELHVWQLTSTKIYCTAHIIFKNTQDYARIMQGITEFFQQNGITQATVQPEFLKETLSALSEQLTTDECLVSCPGELCIGQLCCSNNQHDLSSVSLGHGHSHSHKSSGHSHKNHSHNAGHSHSHSGHSHSHSKLESVEMKKEKSKQCDDPKEEVKDISKSDDICIENA